MIKIQMKEFVGEEVKIKSGEIIQFNKDNQSGKFKYHDSDEGKVVTRNFKCNRDEDVQTTIDYMKKANVRCPFKRSLFSFLGVKRPSLD